MYIWLADAFANIYYTSNKFECTSSKMHNPQTKLKTPLMNRLVLKALHLYSSAQTHCYWSHSVSWFVVLTGPLFSKTQLTIDTFKALKVKALHFGAFGLIETPKLELGCCVKFVLRTLQTNKENWPRGERRKGELFPVFVQGIPTH